MCRCSASGLSTVDTRSQGFKTPRSRPKPKAPRLPCSSQRVFQLKLRLAGGRAPGGAKCAECWGWGLACHDHASAGWGLAKGLPGDSPGCFPHLSQKCTCTNLPDQLSEVPLEVVLLRSRLCLSRQSAHPRSIWIAPQHSLSLSGIR